MSLGRIDPFQAESAMAGKPVRDEISGNSINLQIESETGDLYSPMNLELSTLYFLIQA